MPRRLISLTSIVLALAGTSALSAAAPSPEAFAGTWTGLVIIRPAEYEVDIVLRIERAERGSLQGWISYPTQGVKDQRLESVAAELGGRVTFSTRDDQGVVSAFQGWLSNDGSDIDGDLTESGQRFLFKLHRGAPVTSQPVPSVASLSPTGEELISVFNQDRDRVRVLMILSPTCPMCLNSARIVQRYVLDAIPVPDLRVYVVWEAVGPADTPIIAANAADLIKDYRVRQFWSGDRLVGKTFQNSIGIKDSPAWDVALLFSRGISWPENGTPVFSSFMHNLYNRSELPKDRHLNGDTLAREIGALLSNKPKAASSGRRRVPQVTDH
jgi:hypothetical protein